MAAVTVRRALTLCVALLAGPITACGGGQLPAADRCDPNRGPALSPASVPFAPAKPADPTSSPASALRSGLELLLHEQLDLLSYATAANLDPSSDASRSRGTRAVLTENASAIGWAIGGCDSGVRRGLESLQASRAELIWRYGVDVRRNKPVDAALGSIADRDRRIGKVLARRLHLDAAFVRRQLGLLTDAVLKILASNSVDASIAATRQAADVIDLTAASWADALARRERLPDSASSPAATLRASLTSLSLEPVSLLVRAAQTPRATSSETVPLVGDAAAILDDTSEQLWTARPGAPATGNAPRVSPWRETDHQLVQLAIALALHSPPTDVEPVIGQLATSQQQLALWFSESHQRTSAAAVTTTLQGPTHALLMALHDEAERKPTAAWDIAASDDGFARLAAVIAKATVGARA